MEVGGVKSGDSMKETHVGGTDDGTVVFAESRHLLIFNPGKSLLMICFIFLGLSDKCYPSRVSTILTVSHVDISMMSSWVPSLF